MSDVNQAIVDLDVLGLSESESSYMVLSNATGLTRRQYDFPTSEEKITAFSDWLKKQNELYFFTGGRQGIQTFGELNIGADTARDSWINLYIDSAYQRGIRRARQELKKAGVEINDGMQGILDSDPIQVAFNTPLHADRVGMIYTRAFSSLKEITASMESTISDVLAIGIAEGRGPREIAGALNKAITGQGDDLGILDSLGRKIPAKRRAETIARTEVIRSHHSANIGEYKAAGIAGVSVQVEWLAAGDSRMCPECGRLNGKIFSIDEIEHMIPVHPNCRCVAIPYIPDN
jgi:SPP1 gp7 family putative phage head morphogenesis protein